MPPKTGTPAADEIPSSGNTGNINADPLIFSTIQPDLTATRPSIPAASPSPNLPTYDASCTGEMGVLLGEGGTSSRVHAHNNHKVAKRIKRTETSRDRLSILKFRSLQPLRNNNVEAGWKVAEFRVYGVGSCVPLGYPIRVTAQKPWPTRVSTLYICVLDERKG